MSIIQRETQLEMVVSKNHRPAALQVQEDMET